MRILVACEESQTVTKAFRKLGHEAYSCDVMECSGGRKKWHLMGDVRYFLQDKWDMIIAFPPCTHLAVSGARHFAKKRADGTQQKAIDFFLMLWNQDVEYIAIENPVGIMSTHLRKPDQIIQPYYFGDKAKKTTCLWLKNLPLLKPTNIVEKGEFYISPQGRKIPKWYTDVKDSNGKKIGWNTKAMKKIRSKTFQGVADAMAAQWSNL
ncbi:MAG: hypothetical protein ACR2M6_02760 [Vampirovibrionia bacterium]